MFSDVVSWFERKWAVSLFLALIMAVFIFYVSSIQFEPSTGNGSGILAIAYHFVAFFILSFFLNASIVRGKKKNLGILVFLVLFSYAILDELHQSFVPGRSTAIFDVAINFLGIITAQALYFSSIVLRKRP